ncbi:MAG: archaeosortase/exosortase family protein [Pseudomonadota bacterium]
MITHFSLRFVFLSGFLFVVISTIPNAWFKDPLNQFTAGAVGLILSFLGVPAVVKGVHISHAGFCIKIILECTAVHIVLLYISFVAAFPASLNQKIRGGLSGSALLIGTNLFRITGIFLLGLHSKQLFQYAHVYIGQIFMVLILILMTLYWLQSFVSVFTKDSPLSFLSRLLSFSLILFFVWLFLAKPFVHATYLLVKALLSLFHVMVLIPENIQLYPHTFNSFHIPGYAALILSTKSIDIKKKRRGLIAGLALLWIVYFLFLLHKILLFSLNIKPAEIFFIALILINQWVLPFGLWIAIVRKEIFKPVGIYKCPICGVEKQGIIHHIRANHGGNALSSPAVQDFLKKEGVV